MRYQDVADALERMSTVMTACSREWEISPSTVMCLEVNVFAALRPSTVPEASDTNVTSYRKQIHVTFFDHNARKKEAGDLSAVDMIKAAEYQAVIGHWVLGKLELPPSTSSVVSDRLRQRR